MSISEFFKSLKPKFENEDTRYPAEPEFDYLLNTLVTDIKQVADNFYGQFSVTQCPGYKKIEDLVPKKKTSLALYIAYRLIEVRSKLASKTRIIQPDEESNLHSIYSSLLSSLLRRKLILNDEDIITLFDFFHRNSNPKNYYLEFNKWPLSLAVKQLEKHVKENGLSDSLHDFIKQALTWPEFDENWRNRYSEIEKARRKLQVLLNSAENGEGAITPYKLKENDVAGKYINDSVDKLDREIKERVYKTFNLALTASGARPTSKYLEAAKAVMSQTNTRQFKSCIHDWLNFIIKSRTIELPDHTYTYNGREYLVINYTFLSAGNALLVKGLIWSLIQFSDEETIDIIARLAERSFEKIPGVGPTCSGVGNACIHYLANARGTRGISHLSRLKLKISQNSTRELIAKYIQEESQERGVSSAELEEQSVPDFGLKLGNLGEMFEDYRTRLSVTGIGKTELEWFTPEGKLQKSTPAFVKAVKKYSDKFLKIKNTAKQIQKYSTAQRDRIERCYTDNRQWAYPDFLNYYLNHGLVSFIARRLVWVLFYQGTKTSAIWRNEHWEDVWGNEVKEIGESTKVKLWHPLYANTEEVMLWRKRLEELKIQQPMKQAYREIYIVTEAELETRIYSNRMAAHLLKQHQFNALASVRGWKYKLLGNFDSGKNGEKARIMLPAYNIICEYWINPLFSENNYNDAGIWNYVSTDQIRFMNQSGQVMNLLDVPKIVFSEIMRDVDLFVGVSSVGNDPEWRDRGEVQDYRDYWTRYSFGDLSELAKTRVSVLEQLLPRLNICDRARIDGKFLRVKGKIREYKIHIGSTNILMEPDDQYLCIVPASANEDISNKVFLPFEGDRGLSIILSKAMLLAADDKITDPTILKQITVK